MHSNEYSKEYSMTDFTILRCPICKGVLTAEKTLSCPKCGIDYPIKNGIPILLPDLRSVDHEQDVAVEKQFYEKMFSDLNGYEDGHCIVYGHERIYEFMEGIERGTLLEAGCGGGHHSVSLARRGFKVTSVDLSVNGLLAAKMLAEHEKQNILFLSADIKRLPFADNQFDICFCSLILHHFIGLENIIRELSRVTRKCFIAFEVNALDPISFIRFNILNPTIGVQNISKNQRALFPSTLERTLKQNGFSKSVVQYTDIHEYLGKAAESPKAKMIQTYLKVMRIFPQKFSSNKFLLYATK